jgi:hypothetical protein
MSETASEAVEASEETWQDVIEQTRAMAPAIRDWMDSLGWPDEEITSINLHRPHYLIRTDEDGTRHYKPSGGLIVTIERKPSESAPEAFENTKIAIFARSEGVLQLV